MKLESILSSHENNILFDLEEELAYFKFIKKEPFYIDTDFEDYRESISIPTKDAKFILFSGQGAVGKSALAKHIAYKYNAIYMNLSEMRLGTNSFQGSVIKAIGHRQYSNFIDSLNTGKAMIVIDALDEGEMISGRSRLEGFIAEINDIIKNGSPKSIVLLSRTETAKVIDEYFDKEKIALLHYEIEFFSEKQSKTFIEKKFLDLSKKENITPAENDCINQYYDTIKKNITDKECNSFLGYAPVLEAISTHLNCEKNTKIILNSIRNESKTASINLIIQIIKDLIKREQEKVINAFKLKYDDKINNFSNWDKLYTEEEQLVRIVNYIIYKKIKYDDFRINEMPNDVIEGYIKSIENFITQHPFLSYHENGEYDFAGPAFKEYVLAKLFLSDERDIYAEIYLDEVKQQESPFSRIFFESYCEISNKCILSNHMKYVYNALKASVDAGQETHITIINSDAGIDGCMYIEKYETKKFEKIQDMELNIKFKGDGIEFNQLDDAVIKLPDKNILLGNGLNEISLKNIDILCKKLILNAGKIRINSIDSDSMIVATDYIERNGNKEILVLPDSQLHVFAPNIDHFYELHAYKIKYSNNEDINIDKFIYVLATIFREFRQHRKDTLAKEVNRINNVVIGKNELHKSILEYLLSTNVLYREEYLYKVNKDNLKKMGINLTALFNMDREKISEIYSDYINSKEYSCYKQKMNI